MSNYKMDTLCVQAGYHPANGEPRVLPINQSTTFRYESGEQLGKLFDLEEDGFFYSRLANPTVAAVEEKISALEGGVGAICTASGMSAIQLAVLNICGAGDHMISQRAIYGGSVNLFGVTFKKLGIENTFVQTDIAEEDLEQLIKDNTKLIFIETISNPALEMPDIEMFARVAHKHHIPLMIDNTFATPINCRPKEFGADIVVHSTSKYMDGHAVALGGAVVDLGTFDWTTGDFPGLTKPDPSYHGIVYTDKFGPAAYIVKARVQVMRDLGPMMAPQTAFYLNLGLETLPLRMAKHCDNAMKVAEFLSTQDKISYVNYPNLPGNKFHEMANKYTPKGTCGVISFDIKGGREKAMKLMDSMKLAAICVHVADLRTCLLHPASTTHRQLTDEQLIESGITPGLVRFSVGIEDVEDIIDDLKQALAQI